MRKVFFDTETSNIFSDVGSNDPAKLSLSVVCIYDSGTEKYESFLEDNLQKLWPILEATDLLIGFNSDHFDIPLLNKYYPGDLAKIRSLDILKEVRAVLGRRIKLDDIAEATLGKKKIGHGLDAVKWWRSGEKEKVIKYCLEDVKITKEVYEYAVRNKMLKYREGNVLKEIKLASDLWEKSFITPAMTHTLPF